MVIDMVVDIPTSDKEELHEYPEVIAADIQYTNLASITQYLEAVILTLNYETSSTSRSTARTIKGNISCPSSFFVRYNNMSYLYEVQYVEGNKKKLSNALIVKYNKNCCGEILQMPKLK